MCEDYDVCDNCHQTQKERLLKKTTNKKMKERDGEKAMLTSDSEEDTDSEDEEDEENDVHRDSHSIDQNAVTETMEPLALGEVVGGGGRRVLSLVYGCVEASEERRSESSGVGVADDVGRIRV